MGTLIVGRSLQDAVAVLEAPLVLGGRYEIVRRDGGSLTLPEDDTALLVDFLGFGGFGVVVRSKDKLGIPRALKFFKPQDFSFAGETTTYLHEIGLTNVTPFKSVIRIMDHGEGLGCNGARYGVYVMDFVPGVSLSRFLHYSIVAHRTEILTDRKRREAAYRLVFSLLDQLLEAVRELHEAGVVHMDIKPPNALVLTGQTAFDAPEPADQRPYKLWLTDLGGAKKIRADRLGRTKLVRTPRYFPNHLEHELEYDRGDGSISYPSLLRRWQMIDLFCLGRTLEDLFLDNAVRLAGTDYAQYYNAADERAKEIFWRSLLGAEFDLVTRIVADLVAVNAPIASVAQLQETFAKVARTAPANLRTSVLLTDPYPGMQIRVGDELVDIATPLRPVVDHPMFQRLKTITQLALISEAFPGATHTRFAHSLLTFHLAKRFIHALSQDSLFRYLFTRTDIDTVLCGALLHDLGQYPFAHSLEDLRKAAFGNPAHLGNGIKYDQELLLEMASVPDASGRTIAQYLADIGVRVEDVHALASKEQLKESPLGHNHPMVIAREIVNGTIDVDRISYLHYDSLMTGVPFGRGIDIDGLLRNLVVRYDPPYAVGLAISEAGVNAAEMVLAAVYWMYRNVYWHRTNRLMMAVLKEIFYALLEVGALTFDEYVKRTLFMGDRGALALLEAKWRKTWPHLYNPLSALLSGGRLRYHAVLEVGHRGTQGDLWAKLVFNGTRDNIKKLTARVCELLSQKPEDGDPSVLWDIPLKPRLPAVLDGSGVPEFATRAEAGAGVRLWVRVQAAASDQPEWAHILTYSALANALTQEEDRQGRKVRLFVRDDLVDPSHRRQLARASMELLQEITAAWEVPERAPITSPRSPQPAPPQA